MPKIRCTHSNPNIWNRTARAPYNFVPLPDQIVTVGEAENLPALDSYNGNTGWFDCELMTCSPTYVRGMMTPAQYHRYDPQSEKELSEAEQASLKNDRASFYHNGGEEVEGSPKPIIPGSSLRGMIRAIVEIAGFGKMRWVNDTTKITFRAVAAPHDDPLAEPYKVIIGAFSRNVFAGYWHRQPNGAWTIRPAIRPKQKKLDERAAYLKVKETSISEDAITGFYWFDEYEYLPEYFEVSFNAVNKKGKGGSYACITQIGDPEKQYQHRGTLVCTGNMIESGDGDQKTRRRNHALLLEPDVRAKLLPVSDDLLAAYRESLTPFQREMLWCEGGIEDGAPVFFVTDTEGRVAWFGHTPNFRIPARNQAGKLASVRDFIPAELSHHASQPDLAEAIFGWVEEGKGSDNLDATPQIKQRAGRVTFSDAQFVNSEKGVWYCTGPIKPAPLSSPKITTFQHYLVQDKDKGHDPDRRVTLAHYDNASTSQIRGHKLFWHKGNLQVPLADDDMNETQLTRIRPLNAGVHFRFRVHFENLSDYELGALSWALCLPVGNDKKYRHKLGMAKPLGMGGVGITATLYLTERRERYRNLFSDGRFADGAKVANSGEYAEKFEKFVFDHISSDEKGAAKRFIEVKRVQMLLAMLEWRERSEKWSDRTRYLLIKHPEFKNEYKERSVLPDPMKVSGGGDQ